ncbi:uncharacterized protein LOC114419783 isoform X1 [Glycine soja]|uniref:UPF0047 protein YjbQ isoform B n=1 Tax=Glycine soja TaxID=3848 RepID=A0A445K020_GLYSO|nr:uncharacterized protein LOC114419783 isoform X1 [Glycine soja]RZC04105.1 UPF0047 protein YjbQ isoform B [Glycine soja]
MQATSFWVAKFPFGVRAQQHPTVKRDSMAESTVPKWAQKTVSLPPLRRGCHLVTSKIVKEIEQDLSGFKCGLAHLFLQHTSASLTINENYDSDVREDTETFLNRIVPEGSSAPWKHTLEGPDDMPAHIKSSMFGCTLTIPITNGKLNMGTWQAHSRSSINASIVDSVPKVVVSSNVVKWQHHGGIVWWIFPDRHRQFVKGGLLCWCHRPQWCVYMVEFWPSAIFCHLSLITLVSSNSLVMPYTGRGIYIYIYIYIYFIIS